MWSRFFQLNSLPDVFSHARHVVHIFLSLRGLIPMTVVIIWLPPAGQSLHVTWEISLAGGIGNTFCTWLWWSPDFSLEVEVKRLDNDQMDFYDIFDWHSCSLHDELWEPSTCYHIITSLFPKACAILKRLTNLWTCKTSVQMKTLCFKGWWLSASTERWGTLIILCAFAALINKEHCRYANERTKRVFLNREFGYDYLFMVRIFPRSFLTIEHCYR